MSKKEENEEILRLRQELKETKTRLAYERMRADAYDKMITLAEKEFQIPVRKKIWHQTVNALCKEEKGYKISSLCSLFGVTRQSYYQRQEVDFHRQAIQEMILYYVRQVREDFPRMGYLKLYEKSKWFFQDEFTLGRDAFYHLLRERGLMLKLKKRKARTTDSSHRFFRYKNLVKDFTATAPCRLWVADITYIRLEDGFCYLSLVTDGFSRKIVGWRLSDSLKYVHTRKALEMAIEEAGKEKHSLVGLIHHSDRGVQYAYPDYTDLLCAHRCRISMTQSGDPLENALAERMNGILKQEWLHCHHFTCIEQAQIAVEKAIRLYNTQRPHAALGMKTPQMVHLNQPYQKEEYQIPYPSQETPCGTGAAAPPPTRGDP